MKKKEDLNQLFMQNKKKINSKIQLLKKNEKFTLSRPSVGVKMHGNRYTPDTSIDSKLPNPNVNHNRQNIVSNGQLKINVNEEARSRSVGNKHRNIHKHIYFNNPENPRNAPPEKIRSENPHVLNDQIPNSVNCSNIKKPTKARTSAHSKERPNQKILDKNYPEEQGILS
jgi:hypothetical protein